jgi:hypothetical protein
MSISTPPPPAPRKKSGWGCCGIGCAILALLAILFVGLIGAVCFIGYKSANDLTTDTPATLPSANVTDDVYQATRQKLADFDHDVKNHQAATIQLSGDEINALISHNPDMAKNNIQAYVSLDGNEARLQASLPTAPFTHGIVPNRYFSLDTTFEVHLDQPAKGLDVTFDSLKFGDKPLLSPDSIRDPSAKSLIAWYTAYFNQSINANIRKNPDGAALLDEAKSIEIQNGQLVISTQ